LEQGSTLDRKTIQAAAMSDTDNPLRFLTARIVEVPPADFCPITHPIKAGAEIKIIRSVFETLRATEAVITVHEHKATFWRRRLVKDRHFSYRRHYKGTVRTK
jgi:hypothetical protein